MLLIYVCSSPTYTYIQFLLNRGHIRVLMAANNDIGNDASFHVLKR